MKMKPVVSQSLTLIADNPFSLGNTLPHLVDDEYTYEINDHTIYKAGGYYHLLACVRKTPVGRLIAHWKSESLLNSPWVLQDDVIRASREAGESMVDWKNHEFLQSPFVIKDNGLYYMFYGGYASGVNSDGEKTDSYDEMENAICLMRSEDGENWTRYKNSEGLSRVFMGPGAARDPFVTKFGDLWYIYYCGHHNRNRDTEAIYCRTSKDLINWSEWQIVHYIPKESRPANQTCESPVVIFKEGYYYLFRSGGGISEEGSVSVFRSENPLNFGIEKDEAFKYLVCGINSHAPEIIADENGIEYISRINDPIKKYRIHISPLSWVKDEN